MGALLAAIAGLPILAPPLAEAGAPPLAAKDGNIGLIVWIAFMVIAGIVNWIKSRMEEAKAREAEEQRRAAAQGLSRADPPRAQAQERERAEQIEDEDVDGYEDEEAATLRERREQEARARLLEARAREQAARRQAEIDRAERDAAATRRASLSGRQRAPQVTPVIPPAPATVGIADAGFLAPARAVAPTPTDILPPEVSSRLTEVQRFLVGTEILRAPRQISRRGAKGARAKT